MVRLDPLALRYIYRCFFCKICLHDRCSHCSRVSSRLCRRGLPRRQLCRFLLKKIVSKTLKSKRNLQHDCLLSLPLTFGVKVHLVLFLVVVIFVLLLFGILQLRFPNYSSNGCNWIFNLPGLGLASPCLGPSPRMARSQSKRR